MIKITDKHNCCGCNACANACPQACIVMQSDEEGFLYPVVDKSVCIDCGICEKVCPFQTELEAKQPLQTYAAVNPDEQERYNSSSGGIFSMLMKEVLNKGGVVFGAAFDVEWNVHHIAIERFEDIPKLRGSKYVQSIMGDCYKDVKNYLQQGRNVLFSGTSCQVAGLKQYLRRSYENLTTVDVVCHGVPSPRVWKAYLKYLRRPQGAGVGENTVLSSLIGMPSIAGISFRDKMNGWRKYGFVARYSDDQRESGKFGLPPISTQNEFRESFDVNVYMQGFLNNLYLRPSCHQCKVRCGCCGSDLSLGDFWGIWNIMPEVDDNKGISMVLVNTEKGENILKDINPIIYKASYSDAVKYNPCIERSVIETKWRALFWSIFDDHAPVASISNVINNMKPSLFRRCIGKSKRILKRLLK